VIINDSFFYLKIKLYYFLDELSEALDGMRFNSKQIGFFYRRKVFSLSTLLTLKIIKIKLFVTMN